MKNFFWGIDLGGTRVKVGIVVGEKLVDQKIFPARSASGLAAALPDLKYELEALTAQNKLTLDGLTGIGLAFPGLVDPRSKKILSTNQKYDDAPSVDLPSWVKQNWNVPFVIDNDARMAAAGEWKYGAGRSSNDLVMITIGTGIGSSTVIDGKLLRGKHFQAGCLGGHFSIKYNGRLCNCGNIGCVEAHGSTWSLEETITQHELYGSSLLQHAPALDFSAVFQSAAAGDQLAIQVRQTCMDVWSAGIINLIHAYDPELVIVGGGVLKSADIILPYVREKVNRHAWCPWGKVDIRQGELAEAAGIMGVIACLQYNI